MGAAIGVFDGARGAARPAPALLAGQDDQGPARVRSDAYVLREEFHVELAPERDEPPVIDLDADHFKLVGDFEPHFRPGRRRWSRASG